METLPFRFLLRFERRLLVDALGTEAFERVRTEGPRHLAALLPLLPDTGRPGARPFLVATCYLVAFHRALAERSAADNGALVARVIEHALGRIPRPLRALRRWMFFQPWFYRPFANSIVGDPAVPEGFVGELVEEGPGKFGVNYHRCAIQQFLGRIGATELGPYVCALDMVESEAFGLGLVRTGTIATGAKRCDFRWEKGRGRL